FVRERGAPITGMAFGPGSDPARMIFVGIEPVGGAAAASPPGFRRQLLDIVACHEDGRVQTARIPPGEYVVRAEGYRTQPRHGPFDGLEASDSIGSAPVVVPRDENPPEVQIKLVDPRKEISSVK